MEEQLEKYNLPEGWHWIKLDDISLPVGKAIGKYQSRKEKFKYIDIKSIDNSSQSIKGFKEYTWESAPSRAQQQIQTNDILFATVRPYLKNIAVVTPEYNGEIASSGFCIIRTHLVNHRYVFHYVSSELFVKSVNRLAKGTSYPAVTDRIILEQYIPLPPLEEQVRIVARIEELLSSLDKSRELLEICTRQVKVFRNSVLNTIFNQSHEEKKDWLSYSLEDVCEKITDGSHFSPKSQSQGYSYITVKDIHNDLVDFTNSAKISKEDFLKLVKSGCQPLVGDVLFSKDGTVGKVVLVNYDKEFVVLSSLAILRPANKIISSNFLFYALKSPFFINQALSQKKGVAIRRIVLRDIKQLRLIIPVDILEQEKIAAKLDSIFSYCDELEKDLSDQLAQSIALRSSILKTAFLGKLVENSDAFESPESLLKQVKFEKESSLLARREQRKLSQKFKVMAELSKSLLQVLQEQNNAISTKQLWQLSDKKDNIDAFYAELKAYVESGRIVELPREGKESFVKLTEVNENR